MTIGMIGGKVGALQAEEHHLCCEGQGSQHHVVAAGGHGVLLKIDGVRREENDVAIVELRTTASKLKTGSQKGSYEWPLTPSMPPKLWQND